MSRLVITHLAYAVTVDEQFRVLRDVDLVLEDGVIVEFTPAGRAHPQDGDEVIDGRGRLALPGLVNLHTHLPMTLLRGLAEHVDLQGFLAKVWAAEAAVMDEPTVELGATLGALESLRAGVTTALDMYFHHEAAHRGAVAAGLRHVGGPVFFDGAGPDGLTWADRMAGLARWPAQLAEIGGPHVPVAALPHSTYTCSVEHLREVAAHPAVELLCTHVSENAAENADVLARFGGTPTELLRRAGWFAPEQNAPIVFGHGVHLTDADLTTTGAHEVAVAHCPGSNLKLASGLLNWRTWRAHGIRLGIGTDGCSSSNDLDLWAAMRQAALLASATSADPTTVTAEDIVRAATIDGARALGMGELIGSLEPGKRADLILLDLDQPHLTPVHDVAALLVYAAGRGDVVDVLVEGAPVIRERRSTRLDTGDLLARCRERGEVAGRAAAGQGGAQSS